VVVDDIVRDVQPQAGTTLIPGGEKGAENVVQMLRRDTLSSIADGYPDQVAPGTMYQTGTDS